MRVRAWFQQNFTAFSKMFCQCSPGHGRAHAMDIAARMLNINCDWKQWQVQSGPWTFPIWYSRGLYQCWLTRVCVWHFWSTTSCHRVGAFSWLCLHVSWSSSVFRIVCRLCSFHIPLRCTLWLLCCLPYFTSCTSPMWPVNVPINRCDPWMCP